ncbi:MAG: PAS domain S-box protein [Thermomicrobiales bacterium]
MSVPQSNSRASNQHVTTVLAANADDAVPFASSDELIAAILPIAATETGASSAYFARPAPESEWLVEVAYDARTGVTFAPNGAVILAEHAAPVGASIAIALTDANGARRAVVGVADPSDGAFPPHATKALSRVARILNSMLDLQDQATTLQESDERHRTIVDATAEGLILRLADGRIGAVNRSAEELLGVPADQLVGEVSLPIRHVVVDDDGNELEDATPPGLLTLRTGKPQSNVLISLDRPDGTSIWVSTNARPLIEPGATTPHAVVVSFVDVTERLRAESESRERQIRLMILNSIATAISAGMSVDQIIDHAVRQLAEHFPHYRVIYGPIDSHRQLNVIRSFQPPGMRSLVGHQRDLAAVPEFVQALRSGYVAVDDVQRDERVAPAADRIIAGGARAFLDVMLRIGDEDVAMLGLDAGEPHHWTAHEISTLSDVGGYLAVAISHARHEDERHRASLEMRRTGERFQSLVQQSSDIISIFDHHTNRTYISPSVERILGYTAREMLPKSQAAITHPDDLPAIEQAFAKMRANPGKPIMTQFRLRHRDGSWRWMESVATNLIDDPSVRGFVSNTRDITERRRAEAALRESEQRFRNAFEHALAGMALTDRDGHFSWVNASLCRLLGYTKDELLASSFHAILHPDDLDEARRESNQLFSGEQHSYQRERRFRHQDGHVVWGLLSVSVLHDAEGRPAQVIGQVQDVTARRHAAAALQEANEQLEQLNQAKSDFVSLVSHEFRTPLTGILGFSELIRDEELSVADVKEFANDINADAQRLGRLIDQLLDLDRMQSGRIQLLHSNVDINAVIRQVAQQFRAVSGRHEIRLELADSVPTLSGDRDKLVQVVTNLIANAIKYSPHGGVVTVASRADRHSIHLTIMDQGVGIPTGDLERIFDRYARVEAGASRFIKGIGLGLPIARQIVELHDGRVWADSTLGQGSTFHVVLPVAKSLED